MFLFFDLVGYVLIFDHWEYILDIFYLAYGFILRVGFCDQDI